MEFRYRKMATKKGEINFSPANANVKETNSRKRSHCFKVTNKENVNPKAAKTLWDFSQSTDLILNVEGKDLHVHKKLLIDSSPVFEVMLESDNFVEKNKNKIELPGKNAADVQEMLNYLYPFRLQFTDETNLDNLLNLSREYQISRIKGACERFLISKEASIDNLILAQEYDLTRLKDYCLTQLGKKGLVDLKQHSRFNELHETNQHSLIENQLKEMRSFLSKITEMAYRFGRVDEIVRNRSKDFGYSGLSRNDFDDQ